jgi:hypothetical protein
MMKNNFFFIFKLLVFFSVFYYLFKKKESFTSNNLGQLPKCFKTTHEEIGEREVADRFTTPNACVLEIGGGAGNVSTIIQQKLNNKYDHVVIQPIFGDSREKPMFGGIKNLQINKEACNSKFHIIDHVLKKGEGKKLLELVSKPFDTIVCDCEGCLNGEYEKNPELFEKVNMIQVERDDRPAKKNSYERGKYNDLFDKLNMKLLHKGDGCGRACDTDVWIKIKK